MTRRILARSGRQTQRATQVRRKPRTPDRGSLECGGSLLAPGFAPPVQAKLHVGQANDSLEAEADRVAEQVTRSTSVGAAGEIRADPPRISRLAQTAAPAADAAPPAVEAAIDRMSSSGGSPLDGNARARLEPGFGRDLGAVRVHSDAAAHQAAADLDARAFTVGRDIFFAPGEYRPDSVDGDRLLAHELTHVVQQDGGGHAVATKRIQRVTTAAPAATTESPEEATAPRTFVSKAGSDAGSIELDEGKDTGTLRLPQLRLPTVGKGSKGTSNHPDTGMQGRHAKKGTPLVHGASFALGRPTPRADQRASWRSSVRDDSEAIRDAIEKKATRGAVEDDRGRDVAYLVPRAQDVDDAELNLLAGTPEDLARSERFLIPSWTRTGRTTSYDVDHLHELQLGGADTFENYWLWDSAANQASGRAIHLEIKEAVEGLLGAAADQGFFRKKGSRRGGANEGKIVRPTYEKVRKSWRIEFAKVEGGLEIGVGKRQLDNYWLRSEIIGGQHVDALRALTEKSLAKIGLFGGKPKNLLIFPRVDGGIGKRIPWGAKGGELRDVERADFFRGFKLTQVKYHPDRVGKSGEVGAIYGAGFVKSIVDPVSIALPLKSSPALGLGVWVDTNPIRHFLSSANVPAFSPIRVADAGIDESGALFLDGEILATRALFPGLTLPFGIRGHDVFLDVPIPVDSLRLGPISVTDAALRVGYGKRGAYFDGSIDFAVAGLGSGRLVAGSGLDFAGTFDLDLDFLDPASISVAYEKDAWSGRGKLGLRKGVLPGIEKATVEVGIGPEGPTVVGSALLDIPGLRGIELTAGYDPAAGFVLAAQDIPLPAALLPGVSGGSVTIRVVRSPEGLWKVSGMGAAQIGVAGLTGNLLVIVDGRKLTVSGGALLEQGLIKGGVTFVVTNAPIDPLGNPTDGEPRDEYTAWGTGFASIQFGKYLTGTVQIEILPTGNWKLKGDIALPPTVEIFRRKDLGRPLFEIPDIEIPIAGIPRVASIYLFFGAGVHLDAWVGPASILGAHASIDFDPEHQDQTKVSGQGNVSIGAYAGIKLDVHGGVGAEIPLVDVKAGIHAGMKLGLGTTISAPTKVEWSPLDGLSVETTPTLSIAPVLEFFGYIDLRVLLDLWLDTITVYREKWPLGDVRLPTDMKLDLALPIVWSEENGLDVAIDDRTIPKPDLGAIMSDLADAMIG
jgi:hypothetical protein